MLCIFGISMSVIATTQLLGWTVGPVEHVGYTIILALACEHVVYLSDAFLQSPYELRKDRARFMVAKVGTSVISTSVCTCGVAGLMILTDVPYVSKLGILIFAATAISLIYSLVFHSAILAALG